MTRIVIADDHTIFRHGLREILESEPNLEVVGEAGNAIELLGMLRQQEWDLLILDLNMPGRSGFDALQEIHERWPRRPVLVLSMHPEDQFAIRVMKAGAVGYLTKESAPDDLVRAIRHVEKGGRYISPFVAEQLALTLERDPDRPPHELLTNREFEVLRLIGSGKTVSEIADQLMLSVKTISTYRTRILEKMNLRTNAELTLYAIRNQLVD